MAKILCAKTRVLLFLACLVFISTPITFGLVSDPKAIFAVRTGDKINLKLYVGLLSLNYDVRLRIGPAAAPYPEPFNGIFSLTNNLEQGISALGSFLLDVLSDHWDINLTIPLPSITFQNPQGIQAQTLWANDDWALPRWKPVAVIGLAPKPQDTALNVYIGDTSYAAASESLTFTAPNGATRTVTCTANLGGAIPVPYVCPGVLNSTWFSHSGPFSMFSPLFVPKLTPISLN